MIFKFFFFKYYSCVMSSVMVWISCFAGKTLGLNVFESIERYTTAACSIAKRVTTVDQLLFGQVDVNAFFYFKGRFNDGSSGKSPARTAYTLVGGCFSPNSSPI